MESRNKGNMVIQSVLTGLGMTVLFLLIGTVLDYAVTQLLSQFVLKNCSEDCYFRYFNVIFFAVTILSIAGGFYSSVRIYQRLSKKDRG